MALPPDFWRNDQMLNIFRTKACQRLPRDGVCEWRSQCQFSHNLDWPRRPPAKTSYSPHICENIRLVQGANGEARIENSCREAQRCQWAHSKEEVLYHPTLFKTTLCEEHLGTKNSSRGNTRGKHGRCHRYYCPFAHGTQELRPSELSEDLRNRLIQNALDSFPKDDCCGVCSPHQLKPQGMPAGFVLQNGQPQHHEVASPPHSSTASAYWPVHSQALTDDQSDSKNPYPSSPYAIHQQSSPPNAHFVAVRPWASPDHTAFAMAQGGLGNEGCGLVVSGQHMSQEVAGNMSGQAANTAPTGAHQQQMLVAMGPASPMGCGMGSPSMVQFTPMGQHGHTGVGHLGGSPMQMVQVTPVNANAGHDNGASSPEGMASLLRRAGLEHFVEVFKHQQLLEKEPETITPEQLNVLGMNAVDQKSFRKVIEDRQQQHQQQASGNRGNVVMMPNSAPRTPTMPPQMVMVNEYGHFVQANSPNAYEGNLQTYGYPQMSSPWVNSHSMAQQQTPMMQFVPNVPGDQRSIQNANQAVQLQQQDGQIFFHPLQQIPPFPYPSPAQAMTQLHQGNAPNGVHGMQTPQPPRNNVSSSPSSFVQQPMYSPPQVPPQHHQQPMQHSPQQLPPSNGHQGSHQSLPTNDDSPGSQQAAENESNAHTSSKLKKTRNQKLGNEHRHMKTVEKLLENAQPPVLDITELRKRLGYQGINLDEKLLQHLKAAPEKFKFSVHGQQVTLTKYAQRAEVQQLLDDEGPR